jgi:glycosyltransferase involved in cell wall biosynthesis
MGVDLAVIETHPVQYHAPVYRAVRKRYGIRVAAIYGSDFSVVGYHDAEFGTTFRWDTDLLSGYDAVFLSRVGQGGARSVEEVTARGLGEALQRLKPRAVLLLGYSPRFHRQAFFQARRLGVPLLFRGETTDHARHRSRVRRFARDLFLRWFYRQFSALLYIGKRSFEHYRRLGCPEGKLIFSPYCVDTSAFQTEESDRHLLRDATRRELQLSSDHLVVLFSGKLVPRKAPDLLLHAVKGLPTAARERMVVLFLGDGHLRESLDRLARTEPSVAVRFVGFQNQTQLSRYYHAADILVLPSRGFEPWGLVVNEALAHGLPCIVSDQVGCAPDLITPGVTGEIFESGSVSSLSWALQRATALVGKRTVRDQCRARVSAYSVERAAAGIAQAYWNVVAQSNG